MSYKEKYKDSIESGNNAYTNNKYDSAVNRYYYGIYQEILYAIELSDRSIPKHDMNKENTHNKTISFFREEILRRRYPGKKQFKIIRDFNSGIFQLKSLRHKADYECELINLEEVREAKSMCNQLKKVVL